LDFPTAGKFSLFGETKSFAKQRQRMGFLIEGPALYLDMTARQNLELVRIQRGVPEKRCVEELLERLSLGEAASKRVRSFSLGMRQRLGIAAALLGEPEFLVLDEPINGLDPTGIVEIRRLFQEWNRQKGTTLLVSSYILPELESLATRYVFLNHGRLLQDISATELVER
jgi:ABC-2 type transport system ATP-binding protein